MAVGLDIFVDRKIGVYVECMYVCVCMSTVCAIMSVCRNVSMQVCNEWG